jgi:hypothetical protein
LQRGRQHTRAIAALDVRTQPPQPQAPPQQPPPPAGAGALVAPVSATVVSSFTVSSWPSGQVAGVPESLIGLFISKETAHTRQR